MENHGTKILGENLTIDYVDLNKNNIQFLTTFRCGNDEIDKYFKEKALYDTMSKTFLVLDTTTKNNIKVIGVYSLCCSGYIISSHSKFYVYPAVEIKYFAINEDYQDLQYSLDKDDGCLSGHILSMVIAKIMDFTDNYCGANKIILYSVPDAVNFYTNAGFVHFDEYMIESNERYLEGCSPMYLDLN